MGISRWLAVLLVIIGASSYGLLSPIIKTAYNAGWQEMHITSSQMTMGAVILWVLVLFQRKAWSNPFKGPWIQLSLVGILGLSMCTLLYNAALAELDATVAIVLLFQFTWITIIMESIANRTWPRRNQWLAVAIIMMGTLFSVEIFQADWSRFTVKGLLLGFGSSVAYSFFLFMAGRLKTTMHPLMKSAVMLTSALPLLYLIYPPLFFLQPSGGSLIAWGLLLGALGQAIPTITFMIGIPRIGSTLAAMLGAMELPVGIVASLFILGETVHVGQWFGMLLILAGIILAEKKKPS
ncbi:EamA family transporter [Paenibacillus radicis (ex Xue et al. 2023)]|uniref:DMT family transporter n=1 Tax=Paenibacillus radicis (ex Xue et al. 2023) TaxID=2972489 RepID=A0ABT1YTW0_9BACL|nr:DMT family transporter [Paenibacillus radicis (ex Xue et al. 2023)]MCR8636625.1 DMT family transporter [Paenibacillus radicis (ex Xue et al. 2023)]